MPINLDLDKNGDLTLLDAIAYEFFMDHLNAYIDVGNEEDEVDMQVVKLALASFHVGELFVLARDKYYEQTNDSNS
jgi:hypothetical protein